MARRLASALYAAPSGAVRHTVYPAGTLEPELPDDVRERVADNPKLWLDEDNEGPWSPETDDGTGDEVQALSARFEEDPNAMTVGDLLRLADLRQNDEVRSSMKKAEIITAMGGTLAE